MKHPTKPTHIALDFDKTLATHEVGTGIDKVGEPILPMIELAKEWVKKGYEITIFTARMAHDGPIALKQKAKIHKFLLDNGLPAFDVTCIKWGYFTHFVDDRAYHVDANTGKITTEIDL